MRRFPEPIQNAVAALSRLPGVGPKTALRFVYYLLKQPKSDIHSIARQISNLAEQVKICERCFMYAEQIPCSICTDGKRDPSILCIVEESRDIATIEATKAFSGLYHVLGGTLNPIEGATPETLRIRELKERIENETISEIILALSPNVHGETTMLYLSKNLQDKVPTITRLARGLPIGATLEYADEITLSDALKGRKSSQ